MSATMVPPAPPKKTNRIGLEVLNYKGGKTTLCAGCGHNSISERIVECFYELGVEPWRVAKFSGIGCSSKSPAYFLGMSHGFNSVHGRMPSVASGAVLANRNIIGLGVTGDGDTASIGLGQFMHLLRRNLPLIYIIENNGVYGLTKGQFSATADLGSKLKTGVINDLPPFDCCTLGLAWGATYVARSFSGDKRQLSAILKAAIAHTPAARPSRPSNRFIMFMIATIQASVSGTPAHSGSEWTPRSGNVKWRIQIPKPVAIPAAASWPPSFSHQVRPRKSSIAPTAVATAAPSSRPRVSPPRSRKPSDGTMIPKKSATPPRRGIGRRCTRRESGSSTAPRRRAMPPAAGVSSSTTTSATSAP